MKLISIQRIFLYLKRNIIGKNEAVVQIDPKMTSIPIDLKNKALETPNINAAVVCPNEESVLLAVIEAK